MKYKILLFLCILLITSTIVCAAENTTTDNEKLTGQADNKEIKTTDSPIKKNEVTNNVKTTPASSINLDNSYGETYYGGRITYTTTSTGGDVDDGNIELYVNNTLVATQPAESMGSFDWMYDFENNEILDKYPAGVYPIQVKYKYNNQVLESNTASLSIERGQSAISIGEISVEDGKIIIPATVYASSNEVLVNHGTITAAIDNTDISSINCNSNSILELPGRYQQKTITLKYTDNKNMLTECQETVFLDVIVPGTQNTPTEITVTNSRIINKTHTDSGETIIDGLAIKVDVNVQADNTRVTGGGLKAYHDDKLIASSNNATSIILPVEYNLEEVTLEYTGVDEYKNSTTLFTVMADRITTKTYMSYITTTKNSNVNIYPSITSNTPFLYGKINVYIDDNLVKTISTEDDVYISLNGTRSIISSTLNLEGYDEGVYALKVEVEDNNVFTESEYTTTLTINRVNTYIYANNRTIYVGDTTNLYAYVYANNREVINTGQMSFTIDNILVGTAYVTNNTASIEYPIPSTLNMGQHTLEIVYEGDDSFNTSTKTITLTLVKTSTTTTLKTWTVNDEKIVLNATVRAWNKTINNGNIQAIIDNNVVATGSVSNNTAIITLPNSITTDKTYNLKLVYQGTDLLNTSTYESTQFTFNRKNTTIRMYPYLRTNGTLTLTAYIYSDNYAKVNSGEVIYYINNKQVAAAVVNDNKASTYYDMGEYDSGNYTIKAVYNGSLLFKTSTNTSIVTKNPYYHKTYMNILNKSLTVKRGQSTNINATLTSYTRNITEDIQATISLNATWGSVVYTEDVTFHNGILNHKFTLPSDFQLFTFYGQEITKYTLTITTKKSKNFQETSQTGTMQVGEKTRLYQKTLWAYKGANLTFNTTLQDAAGQKVNTNTKARIDIYTNDAKNLIKTINANITGGVLHYVYQLPQSMTNNTYIVNITALSNNDYAGCYKTVNMTLNNRKTYISASNIKAYIGKGVILNGTIMDSATKNRITQNGEVQIKVDGKLLATVTAKSGVFKYTLNNNYTEGIHNITYTYNGNNYYVNSTRNVNFTSNKNALRISAQTITANIGDSIRITATITNTTGSVVKDKLQAQILLNGKSIASNIDVTDGKLAYNYNIPAGTKTNSKITIIIEETSKYHTRNASTSLKVNKAYQYINTASTTITAKSGSKISITGNITDKNKNLLSNTQINIKISGKNITTITATNGKFNYEYIPTMASGTYDVLLTALANNNYLYTAKHLTLKVN